MCNTFELAVIGMGPAGVGVLKSIQDNPIIAKTICFESGATIGGKSCVAIKNNPCCDSTFCHIISGIGGASNLSSGKISCFPAGSGLVRFFDSEEQMEKTMNQIIEELNEKVRLEKVNVDAAVVSESTDYYKSNNITYKYYDVYEFDGENYCQYLCDSVKALSERGLQVHTNSEILEISYNSTNRHYDITALEHGKSITYTAQSVVLATGMNRLNEKIIPTLADLEKASYEIGVRVEAKSDCFDIPFSTHGDLKLKYKSGRTYCATKDGAILAYRTDGLSLLEGYVDSRKKTTYSNLAVLIERCDSEELDIFLRNYKHNFDGIPIKQKYTEYLDNQSHPENIFTTLDMARKGNINQLFSAEVNTTLIQFIEHVLIKTMHIDRKDIVVVAPELKVKKQFNLSDTFEIMPNAYIVGAATGEFRGILQSLCSGVRCGQFILRR